jgi:hypothetical protein
MKSKKSNFILFFISLLILVSSSCSTSVAEPTSTSTPKVTATITLTPTNTPSPTATPRPTRTPNLAATQRYEDMFTLVQEYYEKSYLATTEGEYIKLRDFKASMAQINYYEWYPTGKTATSFVISAHFKWSTATRTPDVSGCGFVFALQDNDYHYGVFLDKSLLRFLRNDSQGTNRLGKTSGSDDFKYDNPAEADFKLVVNESNAYVFVDDRMIVYSFAKNVNLTGELAFALRSGTNKDYGTSCEITDAHLWISK